MEDTMSFSENLKPIDVVVLSPEFPDCMSACLSGRKAKVLPFHPKRYRFVAGWNTQKGIMLNDDEPRRDFRQAKRA